MIHLPPTVAGIHTKKVKSNDVTLSIEGLRCYMKSWCRTRCAG